MTIGKKEPILVSFLPHITSISFVGIPPLHPPLYLKPNSKDMVVVISVVEVPEEVKETLLVSHTVEMLVEVVEAVVVAHQFSM